VPIIVGRNCGLEEQRYFRFWILDFRLRRFWRISHCLRTWRGLQINLLQEGNYIESNVSPNFPGIPIIELISGTVEQNLSVGRSQAIREFKRWMKENL